MRLTRDVFIFTQCFIRVHDISPVMWNVTCIWCTLVSSAFDTHLKCIYFFYPHSAVLPLLLVWHSHSSRKASVRMWLSYQLTNTVMPYTNDKTPYFVCKSNRPPIEQPVAQEPMTRISRFIAQNHHSFKDIPALQLAGDPFGFPFSNHASLSLTPSRWEQLCKLVEATTLSRWSSMHWEMWFYTIQIQPLQIRHHFAHPVSFYHSVKVRLISSAAFK
jgi:hypothetical protein